MAAGLRSQATARRARGARRGGEPPRRVCAKPPHERRAAGRAALGRSGFEPRGGAHEPHVRSARADVLGGLRRPGPLQRAVVRAHRCAALPHRPPRDPGRRAGPRARAAHARMAPGRALERAGGNPHMHGVAPRARDRDRGAHRRGRRRAVRGGSVGEAPRGVAGGATRAVPRRARGPAAVRVPEAPGRGPERALPRRARAPGGVVCGLPWARARSADGRSTCGPRLRRRRTLSQGPRRIHGEEPAGPDAGRGLARVARR